MQVPCRGDILHLSTVAHTHTRGERRTLLTGAGQVCQQPQRQRRLAKLERHGEEEPRAGARQTRAPGGGSGEGCRVARRAAAPRRRRRRCRCSQRAHLPPHHQRRQPLARARGAPCHCHQQARHHALRARRRVGRQRRRPRARPIGAAHRVVCRRGHGEAAAHGCGAQGRSARGAAQRGVCAQRQAGEGLVEGGKLRVGGGRRGRRRRMR